MVNYVLDNTVCLIKIYRLRGYSIKRIAKLLGMSTSELQIYSKKNKAIAKALLCDSDALNDEVATKLFQNACGYYYDEEVIVKHKNGYEIITLQKKKHPDVKAQIFWLLRRDRYFQSDEPDGDIEDTSKIDKLIGFNDDKK